MEAVALDGLEMLMEPLAKANPNAKAPICQKGNVNHGFDILERLKMVSKHLSN